MISINSNGRLLCFVLQLLQLCLIKINAGLIVVPSHGVMPESNNHRPPEPEAKIEISLNRLSQLFNSLDPSPFHERDLDHDAEDYIIGSAEEVWHHRPLRLVIHLPADQVPQPGGLNLADAVHNFFAAREAHESRQLRLLFREGRIALAIGLTFLFCCVALREVIFSFEHNAASDIFGEGLLIIGWVAMWRPLEIFLYEWVPIRRRCQILGTLATIPVTVRSK